jgi:hypothetical protein
LAGGSGAALHDGWPTLTHIARDAFYHPWDGPWGISFCGRNGKLFTCIGVAFLGAHGYGHGFNDHRHLGRLMEREAGHHLEGAYRGVLLDTTQDDMIFFFFLYVELGSLGVVLGLT